MIIRLCPIPLNWEVMIIPITYAEHGLAWQKALLQYDEIQCIVEFHHSHAIFKSCYLSFLYQFVKSVEIHPHLFSLFTIVWFKASMEVFRPASTWLMVRSSISGNISIISHHVAYREEFFHHCRSCRIPLSHSSMFWSVAVFQFVTEPTPEARSHRTSLSIRASLPWDRDTVHL